MDINNIAKNNNLKFYKKWWEHYAFRAFALAFICATAIFLPFIIFDKGLFLYYGDFNVQQIPFYQTLNEAVSSGNFLWSWNTDLGANTIGSYSFYNFTSPFFWLTVPFSSEWSPYFMGPLLILKLSFMSLTSYLFLKRYVKDKNYAVIGGLLYAFSGASVYNIFFNHFHEAYVFFPLMLCALDKAVIDKKRGVFALSVFACCFVNYYFFVAMVVFTLVYFMLRLITGSYDITVKEFGLLVFEAVIGVLMTCIVLVPTVIVVMQNNRVDSQIYGWSALVYGDEQRYVHILQSLFFPPDIPARPNFTPDSNAKWASLGGWMPLFSMTGVISYLLMHKKSWIKKMLFFCVLCMFIPFLNQTFQLLNYSYYARWYFMFTLIASLATIKCFENPDVDMLRGLRWTVVITVTMALAVGLMPSAKENGEYTKYGLMDYPFRFWTYVAIAFICLAVVYYLLPLINKNKKQFIKSVTACVMVVSAVYSIYIISMGKTQSYDTHGFIIPNVVNAGDKVTLPDSDDDQGFYRTDFYKCMDNTPMFWGLPSIQAFHSIIPASTMEFYPSVGVERGVGSRPETKDYGVRGLTSVKYLFDYTGDSNDFIDKENETPQMVGYSLYDTQNEFDIYINDAYIPMGFTYNQYITKEQYEDISDTYREIALLDAMLLTSEQIQKYSNILTPYERASTTYSTDDYLQLCKERNEVVASTFETSGSGFVSNINMNKENLVFYSVPYEEGWSAFVDGKQVEIEKVNVGFMAVKVPQGEHTVEFKYFTPGLKTGAIVTLFSVLVFVAYWLFICKKHNKKLRG